MPSSKSNPSQGPESWKSATIFSNKSKSVSPKTSLIESSSKKGPSTLWKWPIKLLMLNNSKTSLELIQLKCSFWDSLETSNILKCAESTSFGKLNPLESTMSWKILHPSTVSNSPSIKKDKDPPPSLLMLETLHQIHSINCIYYLINSKKNY